MEQDYCIAAFEEISIFIVAKLSWTDGFSDRIYRYTNSVSHWTALFPTENINANKAKETEKLTEYIAHFMGCLFLVLTSLAALPFI